MYDLEIVIPMSFKDRYKKRAENFQQLGLLNIKEKKVLLTVLVGPEDIETFNIPNVTVQIIKSKDSHETAKTYEYFSNYPSDIQARWIAKFDDDSINDVSTLVDKLDLEFDHERDYYIITEFRPEQHNFEDKILQKLGFQRWFINNAKNVIWHELEGSIVSQSAFKKILSNKLAVQLMSERSKITEGFNDYCLACAARICKIYPSDAYFISRLPLIGEFSLFGGNIAHIHDIAEDKNNHCLDLFKRMLKNDMGGGVNIYNEIVDHEFVYRSRTGTSIIKLNKNGTIHGENSSLKIWHIHPNGALELLKADGGLIVVFDNYENTNLMSGYVPFQDDRPILRKLAQ